MAEFKDRIPVLNDIVNHDDKDPCAQQVPGSDVFDALVDSLQQDMVDRVTRSLRELMSREESAMRTAIRAHLEVMLPEIMEQWQRDCRAAKERAKPLEPKLRFGRDYPGALEPMVALPPRNAGKPPESKA